jgi:hypothetical protein
MSGYHDHSDHLGCDHVDEVGAYLLRALPEDELRAFQTHLSACDGCRREVQSLQMAVDALPLAAPQIVPPPALRDRIMQVVEAEAQLLRAAGPEADRVPVAEAKRSRRWGWAAGFSLRPVAAGALASVLLLVGVAGGVLLSGDDGPSTRNLAAQVSDPGARVTVALRGDKAALHVKNLPSAPFARVYQVWIKRGDTIVPTHTLFNVRKDGSAVVPIEESVAGADQILVTDEQNGGSQKPTTTPLITATLS